MRGNQYVFMNKKTGEILFIFEGEMDAAYAFVFWISENRMFYQKESFENWLNKRAYKTLRGKTDSQIMEELKLTQSKGKLGRMTDGQCLYALLSHFELPEDDYCIYPVRDTIHACMFSDHRFYRIYPLPAWHANEKGVIA